MFKKNEALLLLAVLLSAAALYGVTRGGSSPGEEAGAHVRILIEGKPPIDLDAADYARRGAKETITQSLGDRQCINVIEITDGSVRVTAANCPDQWCVRKGSVPPGNDLIVCLPHRLIVRWVAAPQSAPDVLDVVLR